MVTILTVKKKNTGDVEEVEPTTGKSRRRVRKDKPETNSTGIVQAY